MPRIFTYLAGAFITGLLCFATFTLLPYPFNIAAAIAAIGYPGIAGLRKVPVGSTGMPVFLGGRLMKEVSREREVPRQQPDGTTEMVPEGVRINEPLFQLPEGWCWILPSPLMSVKDVDAREQSVKVDPFTVISKNDVRITIQQSVIRYRTDNPAQFLSVTPEVIRQSLTELVQQGLRSLISGMDDQEVIRRRDAIRAEVKRLVDAHDLEWGIDILQVLIGEFARPDDVQADYELLRREQQQMAAEEVELAHVRARIKELVDMGFTLERAQEVVQTERKKVTKTVDEKRIVLPPETIAAIAAIFGRRS